MEITDLNPIPIRETGFIKKLLQNIWKGRLAYLLLLPLIFFYGLFVLYPSLRTIQFMFMRYEFLRPDRVGFNGLDNLIRRAKDPRV